MRAYLIFGFLLLSLSTDAQSLDKKWVANWNQNRNVKYDNFFYGISQSADYVAIATPISLFAAGVINKDSGLKEKGLRAGISIVGGYGVGYIARKSFKRDRPYLSNHDIFPVQYKDSYSMPSGSTLVAFAAATNLTSSFPKWYVAVPTFGYASAVAYSRIRSGEHYPSDVLVGAVLGAGSVWVSGKLMKWINKD